MSGQNIAIDLLERKSGFPFKVKNIYCCWRWIRPVNLRQIIDDELLEVSIRLDCTAEKCMDEIDGVPCAMAFPHVLIKRPGVCIESKQYDPRDTISFQYPVSMMAELKKMGMLPEKDVWEFQMTPEIESLIKAFHKCLYSIYTPGAPDEIDWICFKLLRELSGNEPQRVNDEKITMQNASVWMKLHYNENLDVADIARQYHMSRATFYRAWKRYFALSPIQYLLELRLEAAVNLLLETPFTIARIAGDVGFCGVDVFHRKFKEKYGLTPAVFRERNRRL